MQEESAEPSSRSLADIDATVGRRLGYRALLVAALLGAGGSGYGVFIGLRYGLSAWEWLSVPPMGLVSGGIALALWFTGDRYIRALAAVVVVAVSFYLLSNLANAIHFRNDLPSALIYLAWLPVLFVFIGAMFVGPSGIHLTWILFAGVMAIVLPALPAEGLSLADPVSNAVIVHLLALAAFIALLYAVAAYRSRFAAASARAEALAEGAAKMQEASYRDALTGLPNRKLLHERLSQLLANDTRLGTGLAVHYINLDAFQEVNAGLGRALGDEVLVEVARRLAGCLRQGDTVARIAADEFVVIEQGAVDTEAVERLAQRLARTVSEPVDAGGRELRLSASIGSSRLRPGAGEDTAPEQLADLLLRQAETAMVRAKRGGAHGWQMYDGSVDQPPGARLALRTGLWRALENNELRLLYQPQVALGSGTLVGAEALVRWEDPEQGLRGPADFIPIAEESGAIVAIGEWVLRRACLTAAGWPSPSTRIEVNVSPIQIERGDLLAVVQRALDESGLSPDRLDLELTESVFARTGDARFQRVFAALREMGVGLVVDDFGTGYSSLLYLKHFPITMLKIDRAFVAGLDTGHVDYAIVKAIITFAGAMDVELLAEGIETEQQRRLLLREGCRLGQGYLFDRPLEDGVLRQRYFPAAPHRTLGGR